MTWNLEWNNLFSNINIGEIKIKHLSTSSLIQIEAIDVDGMGGIVLTYKQFADLIECIKQLTNGEPTS